MAGSTLKPSLCRLLLILTISGQGLCWDLTLVHTNDMHAKLDGIPQPGKDCVESDRCLGGFPRVKYFADWAKRYYKNVLFLNAGDNFQGTPYYTLFKWNIMREFIDNMGFDAMVILIKIQLIDFQSIKYFTSIMFKLT